MNPAQDGDGLLSNNLTITWMMYLIGRIFAVADIDFWLWCYTGLCTVSQ